MRLTASLVVSLCLLLGASLSGAHSSWMAVSGLERVVDARPAGPGMLSIGLSSQFGLSSDERPAELGPGDPTTVEDTEIDVTGLFGLSLGIGEHFELGARVSYVWNTLSRDMTGLRDQPGIQDSEGDDGFSEAHLMLKYGAAASEDEVLWIGVMPWAGFAIYDGGYVPYVVNSSAWDGVWEAGEPMYELRRPMINAGSFHAGADLLLTLDLARNGSPLRLHANTGYHYFKQKFEFTDYRYTSGHAAFDSVEVELEVEDPVFHLAGGLEYLVSPSVTLFAEAEWRHFMKRDHIESDIGPFDDQITAGPGVRFITSSGLAFDLSGSFALTSFDPDYGDLGHRFYQQGASLTDSERANFAPFPGGYAPEWSIGLGLSYLTCISSPRATISGTVRDASTGEPLAALVSFSGVEASPVYSDAATGFYRASVSQGRVLVAASADGYVTKSIELAAEAGLAVTQDFELVPDIGTISGRVVDRQTGAPIMGASVSIASLGVGLTTRSDGSYELEVPSGSYTLEASAEGYTPSTVSVSVGAGERELADIALCVILVEGEVLSFSNIYFEFDSATIKPESYPVLDGVVSALEANPGVNVRIVGHTDSEGPEDYNQILSERRAEAVSDYLVEHGVSVRRLSTAGLGETRPAVPNTSAENRAQNRRIEFEILSAE
ncbi:carboxypeptidase regulatory-like domain-containing protein [Candidatus Fermentibacterales bacterium]|nr:carboxypeptidase regulatory-like domain-containing protein [Candidatus Fermentibacterales bacterium]